MTAAPMKYFILPAQAIDRAMVFGSRFALDAGHAQALQAESVHDAEIAHVLVKLGGGDAGRYG